MNLIVLVKVINAQQCLFEDSRKQTDILDSLIVVNRFKKQLHWSTIHNTEHNPEFFTTHKCCFVRKETWMVQHIQKKHLFLDREQQIE